MIDLLKDLINISSISGNEAKVGQYLVRLFQSRNYLTMTQPVEGDRFNVLATSGEQAKVLLCSHMDTVAPFIPFSEKNGIIYGRGACDAKGQLVALFMALERLRAEGIKNVGLLAVVGEETNSGGAKKAAELTLGSEYVVVGEPTDNMLAIGQKGVLVFKLTAHGTGGHSSLPELGESAVHKLLDVTSQWIRDEWGEDEVLGKSLVNIGMFNGGVGMNVLAPEATAEGIFRVAVSTEAILDNMKKSLPDDIRLEIKSMSGPQHMVEIPGFDTKIVGFGTDAAYLRPLGDIVLYGPGSITVAHRDDEQVRVKDLERAVDDYVRIVKYLLQQ